MKQLQELSNEETVTIRDLVESIITKKFVQANELLENSMLNIAVSSIEETKKEIAQSFFEGIPLEEDKRIGQSVRIHYPEHQRRGMGAQFHGQKGYILNKEDGHYRVVLDNPVHIDGVGKVKDDLWKGSYLKKLKEENLQELSKNTLGSYINKANLDGKKILLKTLSTGNNPKLTKKSFNRDSGINTAVNKLTGGLRYDGKAKAKVPATD